MADDQEKETKGMEVKSAIQEPLSEQKEKEEPVSEQPQPQRTPDSDEAYSIFTTVQKKTIVVAASFCAFFSPLTGSIYYPALNVIAKDLNVSNTAVNLTITTYLVFQGLAPTFIAGFSDGAGRRPAFFICFVVYIAANTGLGAQRSYAALITLRCLQSAGSSGTVALSSGIAADVVSAAERGSYIAIASLGTLLGPMIDPIIGGLISQFLNWHWIFWFLAILSGAVFVPLMLFFPETNRKVVGDGSYPPPLQCQSLTGIMIARSLKKKGVKLDPEKQESLQRNYKLQFPNPFATLIMAFDKACFIILLGNGLVVANMYTVPIGVTSLFHATYGFNQLQIALCFIPFSAGAVMSTFVAGRLLDNNYKKYALRLGLPVVRNRRQDLGNFPIERARMEIALPMVYAGMAVTIAYGWVLKAKTNLAGPLVLLFFIGITQTSAFMAMNTVMIDNYPEQAATAMAANNLFRCLLGAGATAALGSMLNSWSAGWTYTFLSLLWVLYSPAIFLLIKYGPEWRRERAENARVKKEKKDATRQEKQAKQNQKV